MHSMHNVSARMTPPEREKMMTKTYNSHDIRIAGL